MNVASLSPMKWVENVAQLRASRGLARASLHCRATPPPAALTQRQSSWRSCSADECEHGVCPELELRHTLVSHSSGNKGVSSDRGLSPAAREAQLQAQGVRFIFQVRSLEQKACQVLGSQNSLFTHQSFLQSFKKMDILLHAPHCTRT